MKIVQEENLQHVEHQLEQRYQLDPMSCLFFALGMLLRLRLTLFCVLSFTHQQASMTFHRFLYKKPILQLGAFILITSIHLTMTFSKLIHKVHRVLVHLPNGTAL